MAGNYVKCRVCGGKYNADSVLGCPICALGEGRPKMTSKSKGVSIRRRGTAVRGTPLAAEILELASRHTVSAVVKMLRGKVKRSTIYRVIRESTPSPDLLRTIASYLDLFEWYEREGQKGLKPDAVYILLPPGVETSIRRGRASERRLKKMLDASGEESLCYPTVSDAQIEGAGGMILHPTQLLAVGL